MSSNTQDARPVPAGVIADLAEALYQIRRTYLPRGHGRKSARLRADAISEAALHDADAALVSALAKCDEPVGEAVEDADALKLRALAADAREANAKLGGAPMAETKPTMPTLDLAAIEKRAMVLRDVRLPSEQRSEAALLASDDLLLLLMEVRRLRAALSPESADLARRLDAVNLFPVSDKGPRDDLHRAISKSIFAWAFENRPRRGRDHTWDISAWSEAIKVARLVQAYLQQHLGLTPREEATDRGTENR